MDHVASLPITDQATTPRPMQVIRDCLVREMDKARTRPVETGTDGDRQIAFTGETGTIALYRLQSVPNGTKVEAHRRQMIMDHYNEARRCYL